MTPDIEYLLSLEAIRQRSQIVFEAAQKDELSHFDYHASKLPEAAAYVTAVINVSRAPLRYISPAPSPNACTIIQIPRYGPQRFSQAPDIFASVTLARITSSPSLLMADGNTSTLVEYLGSMTSTVDGSMKVAARDSKPRD